MHKYTHIAKFSLEDVKSGLPFCESIPVADGTVCIICLPEGFHPHLWSIWFHVQLNGSRNLVTSSALAPPPIRRINCGTKLQQEGVYGSLWTVEKQLVLQSAHGCVKLGTVLLSDLTQEKNLLLKVNLKIRKLSWECYSPNVPACCIPVTTYKNLISQTEHTEPHAITLIGQEKVRIRFHRGVLLGAAPKFENLLSNGITYVVTNYSYYVIVEFKAFLYTGCFSSDVKTANLKELLKLANEYSCASLQAYVDNQLQSKLEVSNALSLFCFANEHNAVNLAQCCATLIWHRFNEIVDNRPEREALCLRHKQLTAVLTAYQTNRQHRWNMVKSGMMEQQRKIERRVDEGPTGNAKHVWLPENIACVDQALQLDTALQSEQWPLRFARALTQMLCNRGSKNASQAWDNLAHDLTELSRGVA